MTPLLLLARARQWQTSPCWTPWHKSSFFWSINIKSKWKPLFISSCCLFPHPLLVIRGWTKKWPVDQRLWWGGDTSLGEGFRTFLSTARNDRLTPIMTRADGALGHLARVEKLHLTCDAEACTHLDIFPSSPYQTRACSSSSTNICISVRLKPQTSQLPTRPGTCYL